MPIVGIEVDVPFRAASYSLKGIFITRCPPTVSTTFKVTSKEESFTSVVKAFMKEEGTWFPSMSLKIIIFEVGSGKVLR